MFSRRCPDYWWSYEGAKNKKSLSITIEEKSKEKLKMGSVTNYGKSKRVVPVDAPASVIHTYQGSTFPA
jgi:hypothetical protein